MIVSNYRATDRQGESDRIIPQILQLANNLEKHTDRALESLESYRERNENLGIFTILHSQKGLYKLAFQFANAFKEDEYSKFLALMSIASCYIDASQYSEAIEIVKPFRGSYYTAGLFMRIASERAEQGHYDLAVETINYIDRSVEEDRYQAALAVVTAIRATAESGNGVRDMLSQSLQIMNNCGGSLADIVAQYAKIGLYDEALEIVKPIEYENERTATLLNIIWQIKI